MRCLLRICLPGWIGAILILLLGTSISLGIFTSCGFIEIAIIICGLLACRSGNWVLGVAEILLAFYLNIEYGWHNNQLW